MCFDKKIQDTALIGVVIPSHFWYINLYFFRIWEGAFYAVLLYRSCCTVVQVKADVSYFEG